MNYDIDLRRAVKSEEFKNYWAAKEIKKNYKITATKNTISILWDTKDNYATFEVKTFEELDLGVGIYNKGNYEDYADCINEEVEIDTFDCTEIEIAKAIAYYFFTRY